MALVLLPFTFVDTPILVYKHASALSLTLFIQLSSIYAVFVLLDSKGFILAHFFIIELSADHFITLNCITFILKFAIGLAGRSESLVDHH